MAPKKNASGAKKKAQNAADKPAPVLAAEVKPEPKEEPVPEAKVAAVTAEAPKVEKRKAETEKLASAVTAEAPKVEKRKAETEKLASSEAPPAKKPAVALASTEEQVEKVFQEEVDAAVDKRPKLKNKVGFNTADTTLNVVPTFAGQVLASVSEGGLQYLISGAKANAAVKSGRYAYEAKILECVASAADGGWNKGGKSASFAGRQVLRVGFSASSSSALVLGDSEDHVFFDSEGGFNVGKTRKQVSRKCSKDQVLAVFINLDKKTPNANTVSLFVDGVRACSPQPIPEGLDGKQLFPHVSWRGLKLQVNLGSTLIKNLPFNCPALGNAAAADMTDVKLEQAPKGGKYEVVVPVGFPDEGTFDWVDQFIASNPQYVELSDRKILQWAASSGLERKSNANLGRGCNDKPDYNFGLQAMEDFSVKRVLRALSSVVPRNYVIMEVKANLVEEDRNETLMRFSSPVFKKVARVVMGEPPSAWKSAQQAKILKAKQEKLDSEFNATKAERLRKKQIELRQKQFAELRKKKEEEKKKEGDKKEGNQKSVGDAKMDVDAEGDKKGEPAKEGEDDDDAQPPKAELTDEEKARWFAPKALKDLKETTLNQWFGKFSIPSKAQGFDEVVFEWQKEEPSKSYLRKWVVEKKRTTKMDSLVPSQWFQDTYKAWQATFSEWQSAQTTFRASDAGRRDAESKRKVDQGLEEKEEEGDIFSVENVSDIGRGVPLFKDFGLEDWALLQIRYELFLLRAAFEKDANDPDRPGIPEAHLGFYYQKYYKKAMNVKLYGVDTIAAVIELAKDTVSLEDGLLRSVADCPTDDFAKLLKHTEENRRERQRRIDAGDETSRLKISPLALPKKVSPALLKSKQQEAKR